MPRFRAKMSVYSVTQYAAGFKQETVKFNCVYNGSPEDNSFSKATPSGSCELTISNPDLLGKIVPGDSFYLDFAPIGEGETASSA